MLSPQNTRGFGEKSNEGLQFILGWDEQGFPINEVKVNSYGERLFNLEQKYLENYKENLKKSSSLLFKCRLRTVNFRKKRKIERRSCYRNKPMLNTWKWKSWTENTTLKLTIVKSVLWIMQKKF